VPIQFPVSPRIILLCDYGMGGFLPPEMVKRRPVIVVSPRLPRRDGLCAVVPLSGTKPDHPVPYVVQLELAEDLPHPFPQKVWWAKCDMIATVGFKRLDLFRTVRGDGGQRRYLHPKLDDEQFALVKAGIIAGLGISLPD
jgi:mRNA interferase MazF